MYNTFDKIPEKDKEIAISVIGKIQTLAKTLQNKEDNDKISTILKNLKILAYFAYSDLGINANEKFKSLIC